MTDTIYKFFNLQPPAFDAYPQLATMQQHNPTNQYIQASAIRMAPLFSTIGAFCMIASSQAFMLSTSHVNTKTELFMKSTNQIPTSPFRNSKDVAKTVSAASAFFSVFALSRSANAGFFQSDEQDAIDNLSSYQKPVFELLDQLRPSLVPNAVGVYIQTQVLKGGKEDSDVVLNYLENYIKPCQKKMSEVASKLKLANPADQTRIELLPLLMKGHILELGQAITTMKSEDQAKEVAEVSETLAEYLVLSSSKYKVERFVPPRMLSDKEYLGPFGCEFWGKKRVEGSNYCENVPEPEKK